MSPAELERVQTAVTELEKARDFWMSRAIHCGTQWQKAEDHIKAMAAERKAPRANEQPATPIEARYRWLLENFVGADFNWNGTGRCVLVFNWPADVGVGRNLDRNIDAARTAQIDEARRIYEASPNKLDLDRLAEIFATAPDSVETSGKNPPAAPAPAEIVGLRNSATPAPVPAFKNPPASGNPRRDKDLSLESGSQPASAAAAPARTAGDAVCQNPQLAPNRKLPPDAAQGEREAFDPKALYGCIQAIAADLHGPGDDASVVALMEIADQLRAEYLARAALSARPAAPVLAGHFLNTAADGKLPRWEMVDKDYINAPDVVPLYFPLRAAPTFIPPGFEGVGQPELDAKGGA